MSGYSFLQRRTLRRILNETCDLACVGGLFPLFCDVATAGHAQSISAGTIEGRATDPSGAAIEKAAVTIHNLLSGYKQSTITAADGSFRLSNIPPNPYHLEVTASGFSVFSEDVTIRSTVPVRVEAALKLADNRSTVTVEATGADLLEVDPSAHVDADRTLIMKLPAVDAGGGLSQAIVYSTGGVAADANGFFHPLGDHAQVSFVIDGQPISDQQSKLFSTQLPTSAIQNMEAVTGTPAAEFGDKTSLVANITTRSGLGAGRIFGNVDTSYGSFGTTGGSAGLGFGSAKLGNFLTVEGTRTSHFLDTPEFTAFHDKGNNESIFDRFDYQPNGHDAFHLNLFTARNWFQIPNDYDQLAQDQRERVLTWNIAPGFQHTFNSHMLLTVNPYIRKDEVSYYGSRDLFADSPSTQNQSRQLLNWGLKSDLAVTSGRHSLKYGIDLKADTAAGEFRLRDYGLHVQSGVSRCRRERGGRGLDHRSRRLPAGRADGQSRSLAGAGALRPHAGRESVCVPRDTQHQSVRGICAGCDYGGAVADQYRSAGGTLRRDHGD